MQRSECRECRVWAEQRSGEDSGAGGGGSGGLGGGLDMKVHLEILSGMSSARLLPGLCSINGLQGTKHQVLQLQGLHQVSVPDHSWAHKAAVKDNRMQPVSTGKDELRQR